MKNLSDNASDQIIKEDNKVDSITEKDTLTNSEIKNCKKLMKEIEQTYNKLLEKTDELYGLIKYKEINDFNVMLTTNNNVLEKIKELV